MDLGMSRSKMLTVTVPENKEELINRFLDVETIKAEEARRKRGITSHA